MRLRDIIGKVHIMDGISYHMIFWCSFQKNKVAHASRKYNREVIMNDAGSRLVFNNNESVQGPIRVILIDSQ